MSKKRSIRLAPNNGRIYLQLERKLTRYVAELRPACRIRGHGSVRLNSRSESQAGMSRQNLLSLTAQKMKVVIAAAAGNVGC